MLTHGLSTLDNALEKIGELHRLQDKLEAENAALKERLATLERTATVLIEKIRDRYERLAPQSDQQQRDGAFVFIPFADAKLLATALDKPTEERVVV